MTLTPGTKLGPYEILGPIGAGGMGEVYRARDARLSREVAIKVLPASWVGDPDRLHRFEQEARAAGQLNHPNILVVYDTGTHDGMPYVVQELLEGETLRQKISGAPLAIRKALDYAVQIARGLAAAHQKNIVHRDLKPENLFVTQDGRVKILDFGLAKLVAPGGARPSMTEAPTQVETGAGVVLGTVGYMSPEQVRAQTTDHRSDIFSFGSILYEMITGQRAFQGPSSVETMNAILKEDPPEASRARQDLPPGLERIVQHCLEKSPEERFQSARDIAFQLEELSTASSALGARAGPVPARRAAHVGPVITVAAIVLALVAGILAGRLTRPVMPAAVYSQLTFRQGSISSARFTPDGETVVYSAAWDGAPTELFSARPGSPESRSLGLPSAVIVSVSASGEMAVLLDARYTIGFQRTGTLARAPLSGGVPRPILEDVQDADWSPDGQQLAVVRVVEGRYRLEYPIGKVLYEAERWIDSLRFSRDGQRLGFIDHPLEGDNRGRVAVVDISGNLKVLTEFFSTAGGLAWSHDGSEIWFTAGRIGNVQSIYAVDLSGRQRTVAGMPASLLLHDLTASGKSLLSRETFRRGIIGLAPGDTEERDLSWLDWSRPSDLSKDGQWLLFDEQGQGGGSEYSVYLRRTDGSPAVKLGTGYSLCLSPDGKWAATTPVAAPDRIVLLPRGPGESRTVALEGLQLNGAAWHPDGRHMVIQARAEGRLPRLHLLDLEGGAPRPVTPETSQMNWALSPDGASVAVTAPGISPAIYPIAGGASRPIPGLGPDDIVVQWSSDGRTLLVARTRALPARFDLVDLATGLRTPWRELMPADKAGLVDIDFVLASSDLRSYVYSYRRSLSTLYVGQELQ